MESETTNLVIENDLPCGRCGYNLRTLRVDGHCPECGMAVGRTFRGDAWHEADSRWCIDVIIGLAAISVAVIFWVTGQVVMGQGYRIEGVWGILLNVIAVLFLLGTIIMTRAEPNALKEERPWSRRRIFRWGTINVIALFASSRYWGAEGAIFSPGRTAAKTLILINVIAAFPLFWIFAMLVADFCKRAARNTLARFWNVTGWAGLISGFFCAGPTGYWLAFKKAELSTELANLVIVLPTVAVAVFLAGLLVRTTIALWRAGK